MRCASTGKDIEAIASNRGCIVAIRSEAKGCHSGSIRRLSRAGVHVCLEHSGLELMEFNPSMTAPGAESLQELRTRDVQEGEICELFPKCSLSLDL